MSRPKALVVTLLALVATACTVGPDFVRPAMPSQARFARATDVADPVVATACRDFPRE